ncbi:hypothetical protein EDD27_1509 [Nonomuraea polychroma]|uniref:Helix-turn-helix protein n=2 Tax=Nonomuraea polychroma TaxID=46176 RepID=A0A438M0A1_9ACTN|nr:hypothetical protein EDD27_1509 [Nonomuraea polychroma]
MPRALGGGRAPAYARRCWVADALGVNEKTLDSARRQLLADGASGPWLARSRPLGAKRAVRHAALQLPRETGDPYVEVPAWTLNLLSASSESDRRISPAAWRLYALVLANHKDADQPLETSVGHLGSLLDASADTGRRRLGELERAGLTEVTQRRGGRLLVRPVRDPDEAATVAVTYATQGRQHTTSPSHPRAFTPGKTGQSPLANAGSPQKAHDHKTSQLDASRPPAAGDLQSVGGQAPEAGREVSPTHAMPRAARDSATARQAAQLYRHALPTTLAQAIPAFGQRRVLAEIAAELAIRTPAELAERIRRRSEPWRWREDIADVTAVAITIVRRGYHCPDVRCEDHHRLDTGQPCAACTEIAAEVVRRRARALSPGERACVVAAASVSAPPPVHEVTTAADATARLGSPPYEDPAYQAARAKVRALGRRELGKAIVAERPGRGEVTR